MDNININLNDIDKINMTYLLNKQYTIKKNIHAPNTIIEKKDVKFYKKRIIDISKKIINNDLEKNEKNKQLIDTFHLFASKCIDYFETTDKNDEIQETLKNVTNKIKIKKNVTFEDEKNNINEILFKSDDKQYTLDNFVNKKTENNNIILPKQNNFDKYKKSNKNKNIKKKKKANEVKDEK